MSKYEYHQIYMPNHPMAYHNGCISEHRYMASLKIGRVLKPEEHVHHIDGNKDNNCIDNLMVFKTNSDHIAYHRGAHAVLDIDVYYCPDKGDDICPVCGGVKSGRQANICLKCHKKKLASNIPCDKNELNNLIMTHSFVSIGKMYGVSDNAVRKWCKKYNLPYKKKDIKSCAR